MMDAQSVNNEHDLYFNIGMGVLSPAQIADSLKKSAEKSSYSSRIFRLLFRRDPKTKAAASEDVIIVGSGDGTKFVIADCCHPIPGDAVVGFRSKDGTVTVHKKTCRVAEEIATTQGDSVVVPKWEETAEDRSFPVRISVKGIDRVGLLNEISRFISLVMGVNIRHLTLSADQGIFEGYFDVYVSSKDVLDRMVRKLSGIDGIQSVIRTDL